MTTLDLLLLPLGPTLKQARTKTSVTYSDRYESWSVLVSLPRRTANVYVIQCYDPVDSLLDYLLKVWGHRYYMPSLLELTSVFVQHGDTHMACASYEDLFALFKVRLHVYDISVCV